MIIRTAKPVVKPAEPAAESSLDHIVEAFAHAAVSREDAMREIREIRTARERDREERAAVERLERIERLTRGMPPPPTTEATCSPAECIDRVLARYLKRPHTVNNPEMAREIMYRIGEMFAQTHQPDGCADVRVIDSFDNEANRSICITLTLTNGRTITRVLR